ncbi:pregnancy-specific beta-1-glycoprotein 6-like isoform X2 [Sardina pilchardus]|uniref:pregnancy-specific beta-1-glycoprotein 6-like isoform X2 n=1 Tax=Sardina pilchardus TaxID=27697 RepID=UPI002E106634
MEFFTLLQQLLWISLLCSGDFYVSGQECWKPLIDPPSLVVKYGDPASATCRTRYNATMIRWEASAGATQRYNTQQLAWSVDRVTDWTLGVGTGVPCTVYNYTNHDNETLHKYTMTNDYGEDSECQTYLPIVIYKIPRTVTLRLVNHTGRVLVGQQYSLQCEVQSVAPVNNLTVIWFRGDDELEQSSFTQFTIEGDPSQDVTVNTILSITASREDHRASYSCAAHLDMNTAEPIPVIRSKSIRLISDKPRVLNSTGNMSFSVGDKLELSCVADANPSPSFQWKHNGVELPGNNNDTLLIDSVTVNDKGVYECIIRNEHGAVSAKMDVKVEMKGVVVVSALAVILAVGILIWRRPSNRDDPY